MRSLFVTAALFVASSLSAPASNINHVVHEERHVLPRGWSKTAKLEIRSIIPMRIALAQSNMDKFEDYVMEVSDPSSEKYGKHWSAKQVTEPRNHYLESRR